MSHALQVARPLPQIDKLPRRRPLPRRRLKDHIINRLHRWAIRKHPRRAVLRNRGRRRLEDSGGRVRIVERMREQILEVSTVGHEVGKRWQRVRYSVGHLDCLGFGFDYGRIQNVFEPPCDDNLCDGIKSDNSTLPSTPKMQAYCIPHLLI
ncbi:hypothetical protein VC83_05274 [Pseudogymnoascus destructans]|uniref:Uncharacterized protein n=1 Tax=Pseudogymnoascus destructans TaxID=655981 RepID=A0A177A9K6_9PEZI|nr:uncharacterized protein VC83_05274 [Pseudogymnoascus destructans]OAF58082.1 hypothetical protein VC83_05274 [Pseudogymnoascus destructans]